MTDSKTITVDDLHRDPASAIKAAEDGPVEVVDEDGKVRLRITLITLEDEDEAS